MDSNKSLIHINTSIARIEKQILIGNKILSNKIDNKFNEAFYLINNKHIQNRNENFYFELLKDENYILKNEFKFVAKKNADYLNAVQIFNDLILKYPNLKFAYFFRGITFAKLYEIDKSISDYTKTIEIDSGFKFAFEKRGRLYDEQLEHQLAINDFNEAINLDPHNSEFYHERANVLIDIDIKKAMIDYDKSLKLDRNNIRAYNNRGRTLNSLGNKKSSERDYKKAINLSADKIKNTVENEIIYFYSGWAKMKLGLYKESIKDFNKAIELNPNYTNAFSSRADVKEEQNDYLGAIEDYRKCIELNPLDYRSFSDIGQIYEKLNNLSGAIENYTSAIHINKKYSFAYLYRSKARKKIFDSVGSTEDYKKYSELQSILATLEI